MKQINNSTSEMATLLFSLLVIIAFLHIWFTA